MKNDLVKAALLGSSSALGVNWIYDKDLLLNLSKNKKMIFRAIDHELYKQAKNGFDVYPNHDVGQLDFMGEVLYLFHMFMRYESDLTVTRWRSNFYNYFREDFEYDGYRESFARDFLSVYKEELDNLKEPKVFTDHEDKQLVGLIFLFAVYENNRSIDKLFDSMQYARTLTNYKPVHDMNKMIYHVLQSIDNGLTLDVALESSLEFAPKEYLPSLEKALSIKDTYSFIDNYAGVACGLDQSLPLIYHILKHATSWEQALSLNATLGGASSARGIFISGILSKVFGVPDEYLNLLKYKI